MFAVILTVPRVAALRPSAAPAIIKSIIKSKGLESQVLDINLDFHDQFGSRFSEQSYNTIDDYFFNHLNQLDNMTKLHTQNGCKTGLIYLASTTIY